jgi:hypothetical protein
VSTLKEQLGEMVDAHGVKAVVDWLSERCLEKSDYNRAKWPR